MGESRGTTENWIEVWIEEQREKLRATQRRGPSENPGTSQDAEQSQAAGQDRDGVSEWIELGRQMWRSFEQFSSKGLMGIAAPLGWAREHEQAWRAYAAAQVRYRQLEAEMHGQLAAVQMKALASLEHKTRERSAAKRPVANVRELYDLWVECGEQDFAQLAHSAAYCRLQAELANAGVELRSCQQALIERALKQLDLPTRAELNTVHKQLRELRERLERNDKAARASARAPGTRRAKRGTARTKAKRGGR
jgi:hypothetical protein